MKTLTIPSSVRAIAADAFNACDNLTTMRTGYNSFAAQWFAANKPSVRIEYIGTPVEMFSYEQRYDDDTDEDYIAITEYLGTKAAEVTVPVTIAGLPVRMIDAQAFMSSPVTRVVLQEGITDINGNAFTFCYNLSEIILPASVTYMADWPFDFCNSLKNFEVAQANPKFKSVDGVLFSRDGKTLRHYPAGRTQSGYAVPEGVEALNAHAFSFCDHISAMDIPDSVTYIDGRAFSDCTSLTRISLPDGLTELSFAMFDYCTSLAQITLPDSLQSIESCAFRDCTSLSEIHIPFSVTAIEDNAFEDCDGLTMYGIRGGAADLYCQAHGEEYGITFVPET